MVIAVEQMKHRLPESGKNWGEWSLWYNRIDPKGRDQYRFNKGAGVVAQYQFSNLTVATGVRKMLPNPVAEYGASR